MVVITELGTADSKTEKAGEAGDQQAQGSDIVLRQALD